MLRTRFLEVSPYTDLWRDALLLNCREGGRIVNVARVWVAFSSAPGRRHHASIRYGAVAQRAAA